MLQRRPVTLGGAQEGPNAVGTMRRQADWLMARLARVLIRVFFRSVEIDGADRLRRSRPVVLWPTTRTD